MAGTITATQTGNTTGAGFLQVFVLDNATMAGTPATAVAYPTVGVAYSVAITTTQTGSRVFGAICEGNIQTAPTALGNSTIYSSYDDTSDTNEYSAFLTSAATGTPGATTVGASTGAGSSGAGVAAIEVLSSGGTLTVDASTPAAVGNLTNVQTTASFSPPAGAVLLAVVVTNGTATSPGPTITITGTGTLSGLTWTLGVNANALDTGSYQATGVWYATLPGAPAALPAPGIRDWEPLPPGWFPGADKQAAVPAGIPFYSIPQPIVDPGIPPLGMPTPPALPFPPPALPPGWFPGADKQAAEPDGIPFYVQPLPVIDPGAVMVLPPQPPYPSYVPVAPYWTPGDLNHAAPDGIPFYVQPMPDAAPSLPSAPVAPVLCRLADPGGPGWFTDQFSNPKLWVATETWGLPVRAGEWNGGNWALDYDTFFSERAAQGVTVTMTSAFESANDTFTGAPYANGNTWDNLSPWANGTDASAGLNPPFWQRIDYMFASALRNGITIGLDILDETSFLTGGPFATWSTTQMQTFAQVVATRYAMQVNLVWLLGNDVIPPNEATYYAAFQAGLAAAGDTHLVASWWQAEYTSRYEMDNNTESTWGTAYSQFNFVYTYNCGYYGIEYAYGEVANHGAANTIPVIWGDGYWYAGQNTYSVNDRAERQEWWWVLASGSRGILTESNNVYAWNSAACLAAVATDWSFVNTLPAITAYYQSLPEWYNLIPDLSSALVTGGRGTRATGYVSGGSGPQYEPAFTNTWVAASKTPDGTLAVLYIPVAATVTVNTALLATGWTAHWVDPVNAATSSAGAGPTFNSTAKGSNSQGDPDWALVFQAPLAVTLPGAATLTGAGTMTAAGTVVLPSAATLTGAGAMTETVTLGGFAATLAGTGTLAVPGEVTGYSAALTGTGALSAPGVTLGYTATLAGTGTMAAAAVTTAPGAAALTGAGAMTETVTLGGFGATLTGTGAVSVPGVALGYSTALTGTGTLSAPGVILGYSAALAGSGALAVPGVTLGFSAALSGAGTLAAAAVTTAPGAALLTGTGTMTATGVLGGTILGAATFTGTGTLTVPGVVLGYTAALAGSGTLAAAAVLAASATLSGTGVMSETVTLGGFGTALTGTGTLSAPSWILGPSAALTGTGTLAVPGVVLGYSTALTGTGTLTASGAISGFYTPSAALTGAGSMTETVTLGGFGAALTGAGTLTVPGYVLGPSATLTGTGTLAAAGVLAGTAVLTGAGTLTAAGLVGGGLAGAAVLAGTGTLTGTAVLYLPAAGVLAGTGTLTAAGTLILPAAAALAGAGTMTAAVAAYAPGTAALTGTGTLTAAGRLYIPGFASLAGLGALGAAVSGQLPGGAALTGTGLLTSMALLVTPFPFTGIWQAAPLPSRWQAVPLISRWQASPLPSRWEATLVSFAPVAAASLADVNVNWSTFLAGTEVDPTGQTAGQAILPVLFAFPVSSGNPLAPAQAVTWYTGAWLLGTNIRGYVAQCLVGPVGEGGVVQLTAGMTFDVWSQIQGSPEIPKVFVGQQEAY